jgi:Uma2 family endonuclease
MKGNPLRRHLTMNDLEASAILTPDELLRLPDGDSYELIDGHPVEKHMGGESSYVGLEIAHRLKLYAQDRRAGWVLPSDAGYRCFPGRPKLVRKPDVSFIRLGRLPDERIPRGDILIAPDLAVEVVSPNDLCNEVDVKVSEYLDIGVPLVWVVNPEARIAHVHHPDGTARRLRENDEIDGGDVLPGFRCRLADFFPPQPAEQTPST